MSTSDDAAEISALVPMTCQDCGARIYRHETSSRTRCVRCETAREARSRLRQGQSLEAFAALERAGAASGLSMERLAEALRDVGNRLAPVGGDDDIADSLRLLETPGEAVGNGFGRMLGKLDELIERLEEPPAPPLPRRALDLRDE